MREDRYMVHHQERCGRRRRVPERGLLRGRAKDSYRRQLAIRKQGAVTIVLNNRIPSLTQVFVALFSLLRGCSKERYHALDRMIHSWHLKYLALTTERHGEFDMIRIYYCRFIC